MIKSYKLRWCFLMGAILSIGTIFLKPWNLSNVSLIEFIDYILRQHVLIISCWFVHIYHLEKRETRKSPYVRNFISIIWGTIAAALLITLLGKLPANQLVEEIKPTNSLFSLYLIIGIRALFASILTFIVAYIVYSAALIQATRLRSEQMEQAHLKAQLLALQQQISPHFLFNSLSTLKTLVDGQAAKDFIVQLATVYRNVLNFNKHHLTELEDELIFIQSYLYILSQRFENSLEVVLDIAPQYNHYKVPPLAIQQLIENAIKHNTHSPSQPLKISIRSEGSDQLIIENNFQPKNTVEESTGIGLTNIIHRYHLLSDRSVEIKQTDFSFLVILPLLK